MWPLDHVVADGWTNPGHCPKIATQLPRAATGGARDLFLSPFLGPFLPSTFDIYGVWHANAWIFRRLDEPCFAEVVGWTNPGQSPKIATLLPRAATGGAREFFPTPLFGPVRHDNLTVWLCDFA